MASTPPPLQQPALSWQKEDPFPGAAVIPRKRVEKFQRGINPQVGEVLPPLPTPAFGAASDPALCPLWQGQASHKHLRPQLALQEEKREAAAQQAARMDLLLLEEPG